PQALLAQHAAATPDDLALVLPPADRKVAGVIMRALEKDPGARWQRAEDLRLELDAANRTRADLPEELERIQSMGTRAVQMAGFISVGAELSALFLPELPVRPLLAVAGLPLLAVG